MRTLPSISGNSSHLLAEPVARPDLILLRKISKVKGTGCQLNAVAGPGRPPWISAGRSGKRFDLQEALGRGSLLQYDKAGSSGEEVLWTQRECCQDQILDCPDCPPSFHDFEETCSG